MSKQWNAKEAILLASSPREVRECLKTRAERAELFDPISAEAETELLANGERLIDLSLAEYCLYRETASELFQRNLEDWPIRSLVLSNEALANDSFITGFPEILFGSEDALLDFMKEMSADERATLFSNPSLDDGFLEAVLSLGKPWEAMDPDQRLWAISDLANNKKFQLERLTRDYDDGLDWYLAGKPFEAAWALIERLEPSVDGAKHLSILLDRLPADSYSKEGIAEALKRWRTVDAAELIKEETNNKKGRLSDFQKIRQAGARLITSSYDVDLEKFLHSEDLALRCGAYEGARVLKTEQIEAAVEQDVDHARLYLIRNKVSWRSEKTREVLFGLLQGSEGDELRWEFKRREEHYRKEHSEWFQDEEHFELDDRPLSESSIADVVSGIAADESFKQLHQRLSIVEEKQRSLRWMVALALILLLVIVWR